MINFAVISLFPEMFAALNYGITGRAQQRKLMAMHYWNPRDFAKNTHRTVDDRPYGGEQGMIMKVQPLQDAIHAAKAKLGSHTKTIYLSPQGKPLTQNSIQQPIQQPLILVCGRYEGIDERLIELEVDEEWSIGDYVLSGGELAAMVIIDAITRQIPGALGHADSAQYDSFSTGLLEYPQYTRPAEYQGLKVPDVLLSGNHSTITDWRLKQALGRTWQRRPDLLTQHDLSKKEEELLDLFKNEQGD